MTDNLLTIDQQLALRSAAARLAEQFDGVFGTETVERFLTLQLRPVRRTAPPR